MKQITTKMVGRGFAQSTWVFLEQTPETCLIFKPSIHEGGVRGYLVRFKADSSKAWSQVTENDFQKLLFPVGTKIEVELTTESLRRLIESVQENEKIVEQGIYFGKRDYVVTEKDKVIIVNDSTKREIFVRILEKGYSNDFWTLLQESEPELATRLSFGHLQSLRKSVVLEFSHRLQEVYPETSGDNSWQEWIYKNNWIFGVNYLKAIQKTTVNVTGSMPDYLFLAADGFIDVLEIKLPDEEVILEDRTHPGSYRWSSKANEAIGQVVTYLGEIERLQSELQREIKKTHNLKVSCAKPRGFILLGKKEDWDEFKKEALRKLNFALHGVEILTYTDLLQRAEEIVQMFSEKNEV